MGKQVISTLLPLTSQEILKMCYLISGVWSLICGLGLALLRAAPSEIPPNCDVCWALKSLKMFLIYLDETDVVVFIFCYMWFDGNSEENGSTWEQ